MATPEYFRQYHQINRDKRNAQSIARYWANPEAKHEYDRKRREEKHAELVAYDKARQRKRYDHPNYAKRVMLQRVKDRAKRRGIPFDLTLEDIEIPSHCPVLGIPLEYHDKQGGACNSPSLDRINPELGYVKGNVIVISSRANRIKTDASYEEILKVGNWLKNQWPNSM